LTGKFATPGVELVHGIARGVDHVDVPESIDGYILRPVEPVHRHQRPLFERRFHCRTPALTFRAREKRKGLEAELLLDSGLRDKEIATEVRDHERRESPDRTDRIP
jgi:hypothetical protein